MSKPLHRINYEYIPLDESLYQEQITKEQIKYDESIIKFCEFYVSATYPKYPTYPYISSLSLNPKQYNEDVLKYHKDVLKYQKDTLKYNEEYAILCPSIDNLNLAKSELREFKNYQMYEIKHIRFKEYNEQMKNESNKLNQPNKPNQPNKLNKLKMD